MATSRYITDTVFGVSTFYGTAHFTNIIRAAVASGELKTEQMLIRGRQRLDILAGQLFENSELWWILAATSDIGWGLQLPPGTILRVPRLDDVIDLLG
jgi:hypothetical protein